MNINRIKVNNILFIYNKYSKYTTIKLSILNDYFNKKLNYIINNDSKSLKHILKFKIKLKYNLYNRLNIIQKNNLKKINNIFNENIIYTYENNTIFIKILNSKLPLSKNFNKNKFYFYISIKKNNLIFDYNNIKYDNFIIKSNTFLIKSSNYLFNYKKNGLNNKNIYKSNILKNIKIIDEKKKDLIEDLKVKLIEESDSESDKKIIEDLKKDLDTETDTDTGKDKEVIEDLKKKESYKEVIDLSIDEEIIHLPIVNNIFNHLINKIPDTFFIKYKNPENNKIQQYFKIQIFVLDILKTRINSSITSNNYDSTIIFKDIKIYFCYIKSHKYFNIKLNINNITINNITNILEINFSTNKIKLNKTICHFKIIIFDNEIITNNFIISNKNYKTLKLKKHKSPFINTNANDISINNLIFDKR